MPEPRGLNKIGIGQYSHTGREILGELAKVPTSTIDALAHHYLNAVDSLIAYGLDKKTPFIVIDPRFFWLEDFQDLEAL